MSFGNDLVLCLKKRGPKGKGAKGNAGYLQNLRELAEHILSKYSSKQMTQYWIVLAL